jgi:hypothetical protein
MTQPTPEPEVLCALPMPPAVEDPDDQGDDGDQDAPA